MSLGVYSGSGSVPYFGLRRDGGVPYQSIQSVRNTHQRLVRALEVAIEQEQPGSFTNLANMQDWVELAQKHSGHLTAGQLLFAERLLTRTWASGYTEQLTQIANKARKGVHEEIVKYQNSVNGDFLDSDIAQSMVDILQNLRGMDTRMFVGLLPSVYRLPLDRSDSWSLIMSKLEQNPQTVVRFLREAVFSSRRGSDDVKAAAVSLLASIPDLPEQQKRSLLLLIIDQERNPVVRKTAETHFRHLYPTKRWRHPNAYRKLDALLVLAWQGRLLQEESRLWSWLNAG